MNIIGIDPSYAKPLGVAMCLNKKWRVFSQELDELDFMLVRAHDHDVRTVALEDGYIGVNPLVSRKLDQVRGRIQAICERHHMRVVMVNPATWQAALLTQGNYRPKKRAELAKLTMLRASNLLPDCKLTDDQASAVCIAEYVQLTEINS